ncbi:LysM domain-containing protein [Haloactinopolyspora alba]|uniref:LysM domain-containing protein n=1 Tax=Haloactinopolyspora alba TaxID=648780 RepID=A0A2P8E443_9ACTN|nr:LysM peptidoglycan-binding domain-containing protein [Haloactinopolyspora alba]PSL04243.1 LysM domain-containing protein [Haloactinopolyspora alba]
MATTMYEPTEQTNARVVVRSAPVRTQVRTGARRRPSGVPLPVECGGSAPPTVHGARLTRRGRVVLAIAWLVLVAAGVLGVARPWAETSVEPAGETVRIGSGDTLWEVAGEYAPGADPREVVTAIVELNELRSAGDIHAGDRLVLPAVP